MKKVINPVKCEVFDGKYENGFIKIEYNDGRLSLHGVIGPMRGGNCKGSAGQCTEEIRQGVPTKEWTNEMVQKLCDIWDRWHLNDMNPCCEHQRELGWMDLAKEKLTLETKTRGRVSYNKSPLGILSKPCPICGYKYGTSWLKEEVPQEIIDWLFNLPGTEIEPAWV